MKSEVSSAVEVAYNSKALGFLQFNASVDLLLVTIDSYGDGNAQEYDVLLASADTLMSLFSLIGKDPHWAIQLPVDFASLDRNYLLYQKAKKSGNLTITEIAALTASISDVVNDVSGFVVALTPFKVPGAAIWVLSSITSTVAKNIAATSQAWSKIDNISQTSRQEQKALIDTIDQQLNVRQEQVISQYRQLISQEASALGLSTEFVLDHHFTTKVVDQITSFNSEIDRRIE